MKHPKTPEQRGREADKLWREVEALGIPPEDLAPLHKVFDDFRTGTGFTGIVKMPALNLAMDVKLSLQSHIGGGVRVTALQKPPHHAKNRVTQ